MNVQTLPINAATLPTAWRSRLYLLFIVACFAVPLAAAGWLAARGMPGSTVQHGELLHPAQPITVRLTTLDGRITTFRGRWTLLYVGSDDPCAAPCQTALYDLRQVRLALGKDMSRVETLWLLDAMPDAALRHWLAGEHAAMTVGVDAAGLKSALAKAFADADATGDWIYLMDPLGNLLMRYPVTVEPRHLLKDLQRLLKWSRIG